MNLNIFQKVIILLSLGLIAVTTAKAATVVKSGNTATVTNKEPLKGLLSQEIDLEVEHNNRRDR